MPQIYVLINYISIQINFSNQNSQNQKQNLKYNRPNMQKRAFHKISRPLKKISTSKKQIPLSNTAEASLKVLKRKTIQKGRRFGDNINNNIPENSPQMVKKSSSQYTSCSSLIQIQEYLPSICSHIKLMDQKRTKNILTQLLNKTPSSTCITLEMRRILIRWIMQVGQKFILNMQTIHICVQILDYVLIFQENQIKKTNLQLLGITALFIAAKINQIHTPDLNRYLYVCDGLYKLDDVIQMESYILIIIKFDLQFTTINNFTGYLLKNKKTTQTFNNKVQDLSKYILMDFDLFNKYKKIDLSLLILHFVSKIQNSSNQNYQSIQFLEIQGINCQVFNSCYEQIKRLYKKMIQQASFSNKTKNE